MEPAHHDLDSEVSSIAESIRSDYSLQPDMAGPPQPNAESGSSRTKEQEARLEIPSSSRQQQPTTQSTLNNERDRTASEDTPLLGAELPPTYSDAIAAGASAGDPRDAWRRNIRRGRLDMTTFSRLQWSPEAGDEEEDDSVNPLLSRSVLEQQRQPESMGGTPATDREERHRRDGSSRSRRRHRKRTKFRKAVKILCALIGVIAAIVILASLLIRTNSTDKSKVRRSRYRRYKTILTSRPVSKQRQQESRSTHYNHPERTHYSDVPRPCSRSSRSSTRQH